MSTERWQKIDELFCSALGRDAQDRAGFLAEACADDESLRKEVEALLASHQGAGNFMQGLAVEDALQLIAKESGKTLTGRRIGVYEIVKEISQGGMGAVYLAVRADKQYKKQVAIKVVRRGFDTQFIVSRFLSERQILANLDHPNIAKLLDGGTTEDGAPYLVMEYIEGLPIDEYCDTKKLPTAARLGLFRTVCSAVQYAHQNLVIHRDIKPSNILVTEDGIPKLLDFGIAKILAPEPGQAFDETATAMRLMTPDYASPEQVRGEKITTATDIYSLGVLLYKLLTGHHPYRFKAVVPREIERIVCEQEPEEPSISIGRIEEISTPKGKKTITAEQVSSTRDGQPEKLRRLLRGDLDNIVLMAMRKEPQRRYSSVEQFSEDIRRHLEGLPVIARKDTFSYRTSRFIHRNKIGVAAAALIFLTLIGGIVATFWQARVARAERDKAVAEQTKAARINRFLQSVLQYSNPRWYSAGKGKAGPSTTTLDALNDAARRVDSEFADQPEIQADLHQTIGDTYRALFLLDQAKQHFESALQIRRELFGEDNSKVAESIFYLGAVENAQGNFVEAERLCRQALAIQRRRPDEGNNLPFMIQELAGSVVARGDFGAAASLDREALEIFRRRYGNEDITVAFAHVRVGGNYFFTGDLGPAEEHFQQAVRLLRKKSRADFAIALQTLGEVYCAEGQYQKAEPALREALNICIEEFGDPSGPTLAARSSLVHFLCVKGDCAGARTEAERLTKTLQQTESPPYGFAAQVLNVLGLVLTRTGQHARAESHLRESLNISGRPLVKGVLAAETKGILGECLLAQKRHTEAEPFLIESYESFKANQVAHSFRIKESRIRLANLYRDWGKPEQAAKFA
jgi:serine/threonine protein kinase/tetratricopeptide (TPR) repeat protein